MRMAKNFLALVRSHKHMNKAYLRATHSMEGNHAMKECHINFWLFRRHLLSLLSLSLLSVIGDAKQKH